MPGKEYITKLIRFIDGNIEEVNRFYLRRNTKNIRQEKQHGHMVLVEEKMVDGKRSRVKVDVNDSATKSFFQSILVEARLEKLKKNKKLLKNVLSNIEDDSYDAVMAEILKKYSIIDKEYLANLLKDLNEKALKRNKKDISKIGQITFGKPDNYKSDQKKHVTCCGLLVRSKSEAIIVDALCKNNINFEYEAKVYINGKVYVPDFIIRRSDGKIFFWEHLGMIGDSEYLERQKIKLKDYESQGITIYDNLIVTFDKPDGTIDVERIEFEIKNKLLQ